MQVILTMILVIMWLLTCGLSATGGFIVCRRFEKLKREQRPEPVPLSDEDKRTEEKMKKAYENFVRYDGYSQK